MAFRGRGYDHVPEVGGGHQLVGVFARERFERGAEVCLAVDPAGCFAFGATSATVRATSNAKDDKIFAALS